jgi:hypothetical protein
MASTLVGLRLSWRQAIRDRLSLEVGLLAIIVKDRIIRLVALRRQRMREAMISNV